MSAAEGTSAGERALGDLLDRSHRLLPDDIPEEVATTARRLGLVDAFVLVVDMEQRGLVRLDQPTERLEIDGTVAGRVFRSRETHETDEAMWVPLLDGADRVGVLHVVGGNPTARQRARWLASIVAGMIVTKSAFGDAIVRARRTRTMDVATELRWALLPPLTFRSDTVEIAATLEPAYEVAGDAFDYAAGRGIVHAALFDAMGHGLEATRMANLAVAAYRNARRRGDDLVTTVGIIDRVLADQFGVERFVTGVLLTLDTRIGAVRMVSCGHPLPLHLRGTRVLGQVAAPVNVPLGLGVGRPSLIELSLEVGDRLLLFTDGVTEAEAADGTEFGVDRLGDLLARAAMSAEIPSETVRRLTHSVIEHAAELRDDASLLLLGWPNPLQ